MVLTHTTDIQNSGQQYLPPTTNIGETQSPNQQLLPLTARSNGKNHLEIGGCDVVDLVQKFGSPLYILDEETLRTACRQYREAFVHYYPGESQVLYASKAWSCLAVCAIATSEGLGLDIVSGGELYTALQAGVNPDQLYFHGNNKSREELQFAIEAGCNIVVDNWHELKTLVDLSQKAEGRGQEAEGGQDRGTQGHGDTENSSIQNSPSHPTPHTPHPIPILIRLTPGIECHTHEYIRTGHLDSKFGFDPNQLDEVFAFISQQPRLLCIGLHAHIGSQIFELQPHNDLGGVIAQWFSKAAHYGLPVKEINIGGGLGIRYTEADDPPSIKEWAKVVSEAIATACEAQKITFPKLLCEPGRSLIGPACITAYTIGSSKTVPDIRTYVTVDGGMSDNPRPITYQSLYRAVLANRMSTPMTEAVTIAGKHCESGDILIKDAHLPATQPGDVLVVMATGAYNYSMSSNYNRIPRPAAVLVKDGEANLILQRETYQDLMRQDRLPERLK
ncbi:diaminopimelate decarboxylase [Kovacikia minuta CCNUW1]|uniref:diaminopimelate decarboxylase n=1 Tax=Kovacikia minuta TaxID=2931930 RepID=UPI001CCCE1E4|nr:diaminopimelate decarboxylase [Kovacikia minuta]UBF26802.1 diaminopimelate decarboxylase [Kovacikia minuta CCNUW1]